MIKIERWFAPDMIQRYEKKMLKKIKKNYRSNGLANSIKIYFEENGCFSERKVRELLVGKITKQKIQSFPEITKKQRKKLGEFFQIITDLSGIAGSMWNLTNFFKMIKYGMNL